MQRRFSVTPKCLFIKSWHALLLWCMVMLLATHSHASETRLSIVSSVDDYDLSTYLEEFSQQTGIEFEFATLDTADLKMELLVRADTKTLPDAVIVPGDLLGLEVVNYSEIPDSWLSSKQPQASLFHGTVKGKRLGIPILSGNHLILYYNKTFIQEPAANWRTLRAQQSTLPEEVELIAWSYNEMFWLIPFLGAFEAFPYNDGMISLNAQGTSKALAFYHSLAKTGVVARECHYQCSFDKFIAGDVAYMINGSWAFGSFQKALGENFGVALLPQIKGKKMVPYSSVFALAFPGDAINTDKVEALQKLAQFLQSDDTQKRIWRDFGSLPSNTDVINRIKSTDDQNLINFIKQLEASAPMPNDPEMSIVWEALVMGFNRYQGEAFDADEAAEYMQYIAEKTRQELY